MSRRGKLMSLIGLVFLILILLCGWWWFFTGDVETVLPLDEVRCGWLLSPGGDKVVYGSDSVMLMFLSIKQRHKILDICSGFGWLDNTILYFPFENVIVDTNDFSKISYKVVNASEINWETLLTGAETIYALKSEPNFIFVLAPDYKRNPNRNYWINEVENIDEILQGHSYVSVPSIDYNPRLGEKIYSPNQAHYYLFEGDAEGAVITIYDATNDKQLAQTPPDERLYQMAGWAADNTGVYFQLIPTGLGGMFSNRSPLYKLRVP
jgi:hypothetical protein